MDDSERDMREEQLILLRESLQLLAMPAAAQLAFFPPRWAETAFELADYFIGAYRVIVSNHPKRLRADQRRRLDLLHEKAEAAVSVREEELSRTKCALLGNTEWQDLRELARETPILRLASKRRRPRAGTSSSGPTAPPFHPTVNDRDRSGANVYPIKVRGQRVRRHDALRCRVLSRLKSSPPSYSEP
jgi:hypothetical protein